MQRPDVFPVLEPPPGGLARLRDRLERERGRRRRLWAPVLVACAASLALVLLVRFPHRVEPTAIFLSPVSGDVHPALIALGLAAPPREGAELRDGRALRRVPVDAKGVTVYLVGPAAR